MFSTFFTRFSTFHEYLRPIIPHFRQHFPNFAYIMRHLEAYFQRTLRDRQLLPPSSKPLVALSGGADSVALLRLLEQSGFEFEAAHCNFHLRGEEANRDQQFVESLCRQRNIPLHVAHFQTSEYALQKGISIEMAARELRYRFFEETLKNQGLTHIVVAHHRDDNAETMLLNLLRGTGLRGLTGMKWQNGKIVRPLLGASKQDILDYLEEIGQPFVTDSSNLVADVRRNRIRLQILPALKEIYPSAVDSLLQTASHLEESLALQEHCVRQLQHTFCRPQPDGSLHILIKSLLSSPTPNLLLFETLRPWQFNSAQIVEILQSIKHTGAQFHSAKAVLAINREVLIVQPDQQIEFSEQTFTPPAEILTPWGKLKADYISPNELQTLKCAPNTALIDADKTTSLLTLRLVQSGDKFQPFGMRGCKSVSRFLIDAKVPSIEKERQTVVCDHDKIVWLTGHRIAQPFAIRSDKTRQILRLHWQITEKG